MEIELHGLSPNQMALADIMWDLQESEAVESFIATLPPAQKRDCRTIIELMQLAFADELEDTTEAKELLSQF
jgi:thioredoxin-like negative regulator of GroEL